MTALGYPTRWHFDQARLAHVHSPYNAYISIWVASLKLKFNRVWQRASMALVCLVAAAAALIVGRNRRKRAQKHAPHLSRALWAHIGTFLNDIEALYFARHSVPMLTPTLLKYRKSVSRLWWGYDALDLPPHLLETAFAARRWYENNSEKSLLDCDVRRQKLLHSVGSQGRLDVLKLMWKHNYSLTHAVELGAMQHERSDILRWLKDNYLRDAQHSPQKYGYYCLRGCCYCAHAYIDHTYLFRRAQAEEARAQCRDIAKAPAAIRTLYDRALQWL